MVPSLYFLGFGRVEWLLLDSLLHLSNQLLKKLSGINFWKEQVHSTSWSNKILRVDLQHLSAHQKTAILAHDSYCLYIINQRAIPAKDVLCVRLLFNKVELTGFLISALWLWLLNNWKNKNSLAFKIPIVASEDLKHPVLSCRTGTISGVWQNFQGLLTSMM